MLEITSLLVTFTVGLTLCLYGKRKFFALLISCTVMPVFIAVVEILLPYIKGDYTSSWLFSLIMGSMGGILAGSLGVATASILIKKDRKNIYVGSTFVLLAVVLVLSIGIKKDNCGMLSEEARGLVKPYVEDQFTREGDVLLDKLLSNQAPEADEALAYLVNVYIGSHPGEVTTCEAINRGKRILPLIVKYKKCTPKVGHMLFFPERKKISVKADEAIREISKGSKCVD